MMNLMILFGKFYVHKMKINNFKPCLKVFMADFHFNPMYWWQIFF